MEKHCTEANEQSLISRMTRDPNWHQVDALTSNSLTTATLATIAV
jgi:hypothetical protein